MNHFGFFCVDLLTNLVIVVLMNNARKTIFPLTLAAYAALCIWAMQASGSVCDRTECAQVEGSISTTVCRITNIPDTSGKTSGWFCLDCGDGCYVDHVPADDMPDAPDVQSVTVIHGEQP